MAHGGVDKWWDPAKLQGQPRAVLALFLMLPVLLLMADLLTPPSIRFRVAMASVPALAAVFCGSTGVLLIAVETLLAVFVGGLATQTLGKPDFPVQFATMTVISVAAVEASAVRQRRERQLSRVRWVAEVTQRVLLRPLPRQLGSLEISSMYLAADEEATVGGDLYAAAKLGRTVRVLVGDVQGKGLSALEVASQLLGSFRRTAYSRTALPDLAPSLERALREDMEAAALADAHASDEKQNSARFLQEGFVTAVVVDIPEDDGLIRVVNCGHPPPLLLHEREVLRLDPAVPGLPLGLGSFGEDTAYVDTFDFEPGDTLLLYTDGLIEARDAVGAFYPLADRLGEWPRLSPEDLLVAIHNDLLGHVGAKLEDDVAMVAIRRAA